MDVDSIVTLARESLQIAILVGAPVLIAGALLGLLTSLVQAVTQTQDQTISFVIKIFGMLLAFSLTLPYILERLIEFSKTLLENIPESTTIYFQ